jgi:hypothetical protein
MSTSSLADYQRTMGLHLRDPRRYPLPPGQSARRTSVYSALVMNNIEGCLATALPVCKAVLGPRWPKLLRAFCRDARSSTPLFHELSGEFVQWLMQSPPDMKLPPWLLSLAHYEWVELAVEVKETPPVHRWAASDLADWPGDAPVLANPTLETLAYEWPVHLIGPGYRPRKPRPTGLLVFRDQGDRVRFQQANAPTMRLVALLGEVNINSAKPMTPLQACQQVAQEMGCPDDVALIQAGLTQIEALLRDQALIPA